MNACPVPNTICSPLGHLVSLRDDRRTDLPRRARSAPLYIDDGGPLAPLRKTRRRGRSWSESARTAIPARTSCALPSRPATRTTRGHASAAARQPRTFQVPFVPRTSPACWPSMADAPDLHAGYRQPFPPHEDEHQSPGHEPRLGDSPRLWAATSSRRQRPRSARPRRSRMPGPTPVVSGPATARRREQTAMTSDSFLTDAGAVYHPPTCLSYCNIFPPGSVPHRPRLTRWDPAPCAAGSTCVPLPAGIAAGLCETFLTRLLQPGSSPKGFREALMTNVIRNRFVTSIGLGLFLSLVGAAPAALADVGEIDVTTPYTPLNALGTSVKGGRRVAQTGRHQASRLADVSVRQDHPSTNSWSRPTAS